MPAEDESDEDSCPRSRNRIFCATPEMNVTGDGLKRVLRALFGSD